MKKEFKAPIVETKVLSTVNSIMDGDGAMLLSANAGTPGLNVVPVEVDNDYKLWKSNK